MWCGRHACLSMRITIYSKPDCHLCDNAKAILKKMNLDFVEINIEEDPDAYEKYKWEIPVIFVDGKKLFKGRVEEEKLRRALTAR